LRAVLAAFLSFAVLAGVLAACQPKEGSKAPDFKLKGVDGREYTLSSFRGKVVLLDFFATWCGPCRAMTPRLAELRQMYPSEDFVIISVDLGESIDKVREFAEEEGMSWIVLVDPHGNVGSAYGIRAIPTLVLVDKDGTVAWIHVGLTSTAAVSREVSKLLGQPAQLPQEPTQAPEPSGSIRFMLLAAVAIAAVAIAAVALARRK